jgi:hypothetical protein
MDLIPIKVVCYSGYKADEYPIHFYWHNHRFVIKDILDRWYQCEYHPGGQTANYYKICTTGGEEYIIKHEHVSDSWFLIIPNKPIVQFSSN